MIIDEFLIFFVLYGISIFFLFNKNSEYISFTILGAAHLGFMLLIFRNIYDWYRTIVNKENTYLLILLLLIISSMISTLTAFIMIIISLLYLQTIYYREKGSWYELPPEKRIELNYFEYIYIGLIGVFYLLYFASFIKKEIFDFDAYRKLYEIDIFYTFNILFIHLNLNLNP